MAADHLPTPQEARASLEQVAATRRAAAQTARRPAWLDAVFAALAGVAIGLTVIGELPQRIAGIAVLLVGCIGLAVAERRLVRRRGRVLDERSIRAQPLRFFIPWTIVFLLAMVRPPAHWQPWYAIGAGIVVAIAGFAYLRADDRYQARRLAAGDYDRYDLL